MTRETRGSGDSWDLAHASCRVISAPGLSPGPETPALQLSGPMFATQQLHVVSSLQQSPAGQAGFTPVGVHAPPASTAFLRGYLASSLLSEGDCSAPTGACPGEQRGSRAGTSWHLFSSGPRRLGCPAHLPPHTESGGHGESDFMPNCHFLLTCEVYIHASSRHFFSFNSPEVVVYF